MKRIIMLAIFFIVFSSISSFADNGFEKIHKVNLSKDQIHNAVIEWIATTFNDPSSVIKLNDKAGGKIIVKGLMDTGYYSELFNVGRPLTAQCKFTIKIDIKDNKYRAIYCDIIPVIADPQQSRTTNINSKKNIKINTDSMTRIDNRLLSFVKKSKKKDNW